MFYSAFMDHFVRFHTSGRAYRF